MPWNWELPGWPILHCDPSKVGRQEKEFLLNVGNAGAFLKAVNIEDRNRFVVEILSTEGVKSSKIEGEILDRESLQSSIGKHFGLEPYGSKVSSQKEIAMANLLCNVYETFNAPLTHEMLFAWHAMLFYESSAVVEKGRYRSHEEPMQIVSGRLDKKQVFFEAPPSSQVYHEMDRFIIWFNREVNAEGSILAKAATMHVYFESIHPFEDGNGRIGRALVEKILSQGVGQPILIAISKILEKDKKVYYASLEQCNQTLEIQSFVEFFANVIVKAQQDSIHFLYFLIAKTKLLSTLSQKLNERQEKVLVRMFAEGVEGFKGGLSAENYIKIAKTSRATATRDLRELVEMGALLKTGELRHTRYWLNLK